MERSQEESTDILIAILGVGLDTVGWGMAVLGPDSIWSKAISWAMICSGSLMIVYAGKKLAGRVFDRHFRRRECAFKRKMDSSISEALEIRRQIPRGTLQVLAGQMLGIGHLVADDIEEALGRVRAHEMLNIVQSCFSQAAMMTLGEGHLKIGIDHFIDEVKKVRDSAKESELIQDYDPRETP